MGEVGTVLNQVSETFTWLSETGQGDAARLRAIVEAMVEGVLVTDARGEITFTNAAFDALGHADSAGSSVMEVIRSPELHVAIQDASQGTSQRVEFDLPTERGELRSFEAGVSPIGKEGAVIVVFHEVTQTKMADRVRRDFVANASHELRTPLTAIKGYAETLQQGALQDPETAPRFLDVILKHTARLEALVKDLSVLSSAESDERVVDPQDVDVRAMLTEIVQGLEGQAKKKGLQMTLNADDLVQTAYCDPHALDQVLVNLIDNAIKYTPQGGQVVVQASDDDTRVRISVMNSGPGIPSVHLDRIFERFYRVDASRSRELGGTGLGLSIVRHLVASMHGEVHVESRPGQTVFTVALPVASRS